MPNQTMPNQAMLNQTTPNQKKEDQASGTVAVVLYMPVVHNGYVAFLQKIAKRHQGLNKKIVIYLVSSAVFPEYRALVKDLRAMPVAVLKKQLGIVLQEYPDLAVYDSEIRVVDAMSMSSENKVVPGAELASADEVIFPDEELSHNLYETYLVDFVPKEKVTYEGIFLRWDAKKSQSRSDVHPSQKITSEEFHKTIMTQAMSEASHSLDWWRQVGAALVVSNSVVSNSDIAIPKNQAVTNTSAQVPLLVARNTHLPYDQQPYVDGDPRADYSSGEHIEMATSIHAEAFVVAQAAQKGISLQGASLYVTTFPCPVCARLLAKTGISKIFYSEGYSLLHGQEILEHAGIELIQVV